LQSSNLIRTLKNAKELNANLILENEKLVKEETTDSRFLNKIVDILNNNIADESLNVEKLAKLLNLSKSQMYRKIVALTDMSVSEFIRINRLSKGRTLLLNQEGNISEVAYKVGLSPSYFSKSFKKVYGFSPKKILKENA